MKEKRISQEGLKLIACITMLIDHIGAVLVPGHGFRIVGRIAFPIYCFLLVEGAVHSRNLKKYGRRLLIGALLAELPFDYLFYGGITWEHQSVMITLLLGFLMVVWAKKRGNAMLSLPLCFFAAEFLRTDYGGWGIAMIGIFLITMEKSREKLWQILGLALIFWCMDSYRISLGVLQVPIQMFGLLSMVPIHFYSGRKITHSKAVQWVFYLFYPLHLLILFWISRL